MHLIHQLLSSSGFVSISESATLVRKAVRTAFDEFGESVADAFVQNLADIHKMPVEVILVDYPVLEKSVKRVFGYGAELITDSIRKNLIKTMPGLPPSLSTGDMVSQILESETTKFLRHLPNAEHIVLLHREAEAKEKMISAFLDAAAARGVIFSGDRQYGSDIHSVSYEDILKKEDKQNSMKNLADWIGGVRAKGKVARIIGQDDAWFINNGFAEELMALEKGLGPKLEDGMSVFCTYDLQNTSSVHLHDIITSHDYVLLDNPMVVYGRRGGK